MRKHRFAWGVSMLAVATLVLGACSDVEEGGETTDGGGDPFSHRTMGCGTPRSKTVASVPA